MSRLTFTKKIKQERPIEKRGVIIYNIGELNQRLGGGTMK